jgi:hypothetical protein
LQSFREHKHKRLPQDKSDTSDGLPARRSRCPRSPGSLVGSQGGERRQGFWPSLLRRRRFFWAFRLRALFAGSHTCPARPPRRQAPQDCRRLSLLWGGAEIRRSRMWSLKPVLDALRVPAARPGTRHFRAEHVAGKARSGGPPGLEGPSRPFKPPRASRPPDLKTF